MKQGIHPEYGPAKIVCGCGSVLEINATAKTISLDICSVCHPFYTGTQKLVDTAGRVEKFRRRVAKAEPKQQ